MAAQPYAPTPVRAADELEKIDFDAFGQIHFRPEDTLKTDGTDVQFFHLGRYFKQPVKISVVEGGNTREVLYSPDLFDMPAGHVARTLPRDLGFAGFRVMNPGDKNDWFAILGASYFRTSGPFDQYGLSARGLAIDTATQGTEEFPRFSEFWMEGDGKGGLSLWALLEGPSVAGAYRIVSTRHDGIIQDVEAALYMRNNVERLGAAPLTSMFWYGKNGRGSARDWRPEIHDSDGLAIWTGAGERIWRPLSNPPHTMVNSFLDNNPRGFGLLQRERSFEDYQDDGAFYDRRASLWVEPLSGWGRGSVQLVELNTTDEIHDNIVAYWVPADPVRAGAQLDFHYRLSWIAEEPQPPAVARVVATRLGEGGRPGVAEANAGTKFVIDIEGPTLAGLTRQSGVEAVVSTSRGTIVDPVAYPVVGTDRWRILFDLKVDGSDPVDLRAYARRGTTALSETWLYQFFPGSVA